MQNFKQSNEFGTTLSLGILQRAANSTLTSLCGPSRCRGNESIQWTDNKLQYGTEENETMHPVSMQDISGAANCPAVLDMYRGHKWFKSGPEEYCTTHLNYIQQVL